MEALLNCICSRFFIRQTTKLPPCYQWERQREREREHLFAWFTQAKPVNWRETLVGCDRFEYLNSNRSFWLVETQDIGGFNPLDFFLNEPAVTVIFDIWQQTDRYNFQYSVYSWISRQLVVIFRRIGWDSIGLFDKVLVKFCGDFFVISLSVLWKCKLNSVKMVSGKLVIIFWIFFYNWLLTFRDKYFPYSKTNYNSIV